MQIFTSLYFTPLRNPFQHLSFLLPLLFLLSSPILANYDPGTVSLFSEAAYSDQRQCVTNCNGLPGLCIWCQNIGNMLGCSSPYKNSCYCRTDLTSSALSMISTCVWTGCSQNEDDLSTALYLYSSYCHVMAVATPTNAGGAGPNSAAPGGNGASNPTATAQSGGNSASGNHDICDNGGSITNSTLVCPNNVNGGLSMRDKIALGTALGVGLPTAIIVFLAFSA